MADSGNWDSPLLSEAVFVWTGWGKEMSPRRDDALVVSRFGVDIAAKLLPAIKSLMDEFYLADARLFAADLSKMSAMAVAEFKERHPEVPDKVVEALAWCYTFDFK